MFVCQSVHLFVFLSPVWLCMSMCLSPKSVVDHSTGKPVAHQATGLEHHTSLMVAAATARPTVQDKKQSRTCARSVELYVHTT